MDEKEKRDKEELKQQLRDMNFSQKLEYFWMYYKWVIVCAIAAVFVIAFGIDWFKSLEDRTVIGIIAGNCFAPAESAEEEIKEILGTDDPHDKVELRTTVSVNSETGELDYYSNMAFLAVYSSGNLNLIVMPEVGAEKMREAVEWVSLDEVFGPEEADQYRQYEDNGIIRLPEGSCLTKLLDLAYDPVCVIVVDARFNMENTKTLLKAALESAQASPAE